MGEKRQISHTEFQIFYEGTAASGEGHGNPSSILAWENPMDRGAWWATVHGVTESRIWLTAVLWRWNTIPHFQVWAAHSNFFPKRTDWKRVGKRLTLQWRSLTPSARWSRSTSAEVIDRWDYVKWHFPSMVFLPQTHNPSRIIRKHRQFPIEGQDDQYSSKLSKASKTRKFWDTATANKHLRRHDN